MEKSKNTNLLNMRNLQQKQIEELSNSFFVTVGIIYSLICQKVN